MQGILAQEKMSLNAVIKVCLLFKSINQVWVYGYNSDFWPIRMHVVTHLFYNSLCVI